MSWLDNTTITRMTDHNVIYARISLDSNDDEAGVKRQVAACRARAEELGLDIRTVYVDNSISASSGAVRPEFERLLRDKPDTVIVWHLDRLLRKSSRDLERVLDLGFSVRSLQGGDFDLNTSTGRALARTVVAWAQNEVELKAARQRGANEERVLSGKLYGRKLAYGWKDLHGLQVDEGAAERIRAGAQAVLSGASLREVALQWNKQGPKPSGTPWEPIDVRQTLLRPMNAGIVSYKGTEYRDVRAEWVPLFDVETYDALRAALASRSVSAGSTGVTADKVRQHLMGGLLTCQGCDSVMHGGLTNGEPAYVCSGKVKGCFRAIKAEVVDRYVLHWTALCLLDVNPERFLSKAAVQRLSELDKELRTVRQERQEVAHADLSVSSKVALLGALDKREQAVRTEAAGLTRDSAIAELVRTLTLPEDTGDIDQDFENFKAHVEEVEKRLKALTLRQQRLVIQTFSTFSIAPGRGKDRVKVGGPMAEALHKIAAEGWDHGRTT